MYTYNTTVFAFLRRRSPADNRVGWVLTLHGQVVGGERRSESEIRLIYKGGERPFSFLLTGSVMEFQVRESIGRTKVHTPVICWLYSASSKAD